MVMKLGIQFLYMLLSFKNKNQFFGKNGQRPPLTCLACYHMLVLLLMSRSGLVSKWLHHWIYYDLRVYISLKQVQFAQIKTQQVFLSVANTVAVVNTCSSTAGVRNSFTSKTPNLLSFIPSCQDVYFIITTSFKKNLWQLYNRNTALTNRERAIKICTLCNE